MNDIAQVTFKLAQPITKADGSPVTDINNNPVTTTTTDADGNYLFKDLPLGVAYKVTVVPPADTVASPAETGSDRAVDSSDGSATSSTMTALNLTDFTLDFGFVPKVSVGNLVWFDTNYDGIQGDSEPGIAGVTLSITKADGSPVTDVYGNPVTTTTTDINGNYLFADLPPGQYTVRVSTPAGYVPTVSGNGTAASDSSRDTATSEPLQTAGALDDTLDFGFVGPSVSLGDRVWLDTNRDGVQSAGEPGVTGVTLSITKADGSPVTDIYGNPVTTTTTDTNGNYLFADLPPGRYRIAVLTPEGYSLTRPGKGSSTTDSADRIATSFELQADGATDRTLDFGFVRLLPPTGGDPVAPLGLAAVLLLSGAMLMRVHASGRRRRSPVAGRQTAG